MAEGDIGGAFHRPFNEQVAFFRNKLGNLVPTERWDDMVRKAHDHGFMVAGATAADLLSDLAGAVDKAIGEGTGIDAFRRDFRTIVARNGWTGWTGEGSLKGEAWRVGVIYRTNMATSYAAGRYAQLVEGNFPIWVYRHGGSREPRPEHLSWDGWCGPPDHAFWKTHYPPSDWGCSCYVLGARSEAGARRLGGNPGKKLPANWQSRDPRTGAPVGIGRNWDYAPGASVAELVNVIAQKVRHWDYAIAKAFMNTLPAETVDELADAYRRLATTADDTRRYAERVLDPPPIDRGIDPAAPPPVKTLGMVRSDQTREIAAIKIIDVSGYDFSLDPYAVRHVRKEHGNTKMEERRGQRAITGEDYALLPRLISDAQSIEDAGKSWRSGLPLVRLIWDREDEQRVAIFEVRKGKLTLALETLLTRTRK